VEGTLQRLLEVWGALGVVLALSILTLSILAIISLSRKIKDLSGRIEEQRAELRVLVKEVSVVASSVYDAQRKISDLMAIVNPPPKLSSRSWQ
jgi:predicted Holliday junction resolvase-like endonuclease